MGRVSFLVIIFIVSFTASWGHASSSLCGVLTAWSGDPLLAELTPSQIEAIGRLPGEAEFAEPLSQALAVGDWSHPLLDPKRTDAERVVRAALGLYLKKSISIFQFATLSLRWQTQKDFGAFATREMETLSLRQAGGGLTYAANLLLQNADQRDRWSGALNDDQLAQFARDELPLFASSERYFFVLRISEEHFNNAAAPSLMNLSKVLSFITDTRVFVRSVNDWPGVLREGEVAIIVPSLSILQSRLRVLHGPNHMQLQPLLGKSTAESVVEHSERGYRVFAVGFPTLPDPMTADQFTTHWTGFSWHDYFHAAEGSKINPLYRMIFLRVARLAHEKAPRHADAEHLWRKAVDLDSNTWEGLDWETRFRRDFGNGNALGSRLLRSDLVQHPDWYRERGISAEAIAALVPASRWTLPQFWPATP